MFCTFITNTTEKCTTALVNITSNQFKHIVFRKFKLKVTIVSIKLVKSVYVRQHLDVKILSISKDYATCTFNS